MSGGGMQSAWTPPLESSAQIRMAGGGMRLARTLPLESSAQPPGLTKVDSLFESRNPAILGSGAWFRGGYRLEVDPDGNCFGTSWMVASLLWAVQRPGYLNSFADKLKEAGQPGGAFGIVETICKRYIDCFISYVDDLSSKWNHVQTDEEATCGISLAVGVVRTLRGPSKVGCGLGQEEGSEPLWLQLKWGIALAARALDVRSAPVNLTNADMVKLRQVGESVEFTLGMAHAVSTSLPKAGKAADTPVDDAVRPGRGLGLVVGVVVASLAPDKGRPTEGNIDATPDRVRQKTIHQDTIRRLRLQDFSEHFRGLTRDTPVTGLAVVKGATPHFDVLAAAGTPLAAALANSFGIGGGEMKAFQDIQSQIEAQKVMTTEEVAALLHPEELESQLELWKNFGNTNASAEKTAKGIDSRSAKDSGNGFHRLNKLG